MAAIQPPQEHSVNVAELRSYLGDALEKRLYSTAIFFANKLVSLTGDISDTIQLAQAYYNTQQYRRALAQLKAFWPVSKESRYISALCKAKCQDWDGCLELISEPALTATKDSPAAGPSAPSTKKINLEAAICLLRGDAFEALDMRPKAVHWYKQALVKDVMCFEAFEKLIDNSMLTHSQELELLKSLTFPPESSWMQEFYRTKLKLFTESQQIDEAHDKLEECGLGDNSAVLTNKAEALFYCNEYQRAFQITTKILEADPHDYGTVRIIHLSCLVELELRNELFYMAHTMVEENPKMAIAWYAVGCYYYCIKHYQLARRYLSKATTINGAFGPAWLAFGHCFSMENDHDQAMAAYRTAARLLTGSHIPLISIAGELLRAGNHPAASEFLEKALRVNPTDPHIYNLLGVIAYESKDYLKAVTHFNHTLRLCLRHRSYSTDTDDPMAIASPGGADFGEFNGGELAVIGESWEPTLFNLGHCHRKLKQYSLAIKFYSMASTILPNNASALVALGLAHHLDGKLTEAIEFYHQALGLQPDDTLASQLLETALREQMHEMPLTDVVQV